MNTAFIVARPPKVSLNPMEAATELMAQEFEMLHIDCEDPQLDKVRVTIPL